MNVDVEVTVFCEAIRKGCTFVARLHVDGTFYSGNGASAFEALAWCMHDYVARGVLGHEPSLARNADVRPGDGLVAAPSSRPRRMTPAPIATGPVLAQENASAKDEIGCFDRVIPTSAAPRLFGLQPVDTPTPKKTRTARGGSR